MNNDNYIPHCLALSGDLAVVSYCKLCCPQSSKIWITWIFPHVENKKEILKILGFFPCGSDTRSDESLLVSPC